MEPMDSSQSVSLKLCLYGAREATIEKSFDQAATLSEIQQEMRKLFNVGPERETKLWINSSVYTFKPAPTNDVITDGDGGADENNINSSTTTSNSNPITNSTTSATSAPTIKVTTNSTTTTLTNTTNSNNNGAVSSSSNVNNNIVVAAESKSNTVAAAATTSPIKPPPTPPPMPSSSSSSTDSPSSGNSSTTSNIITRQAASALNNNGTKPIALPDSSTPDDEQSFYHDRLLNNHQSAPNQSSSSSSTTTKENESLTSRLADVGVSGSAVVTLEVINNDGTWPSSRPRYGTVTTRSSKAQPGLCGLSNMGNTCFMNAALQCLSNTPPITNYILTDKFLDDINTNNPLGMHGEIARTYAELIKIMWSGNHSSYLPREFKCAVSRFAPQFTGFAQQDCQELMAFLLDGLHEDLNRIRNKPYIEVKNEIERRPDEVVAEESWTNYKRRNDSIVVDTFHAMLKSTLVCPECKLVSVTFDPFCYLSLPLPVKREKQVNLLFQPAPGPIDKEKIKTVLKILDPEDAKTILTYGGSISSVNGLIEEHGGYVDAMAQPKGCKLQVPRTGPAGELCEIVARIMNDERGPDAKKVEADNLVIAELAIGGISKIYESNEHYNQLSDAIVVIEKRSNYVLPLYLKERKTGSSMQSLMSDWLFLHIPDLKYETLYKSIISSLSNLTTESEEEIRSWCKFNTPVESETMDCDAVEDESYINSTGDADHDNISSSESAEVRTNGKEANNTSLSSSSRAAFDLCLVNSFGTHSFETIGPTTREYDYNTKLYLGAVFKPEAASSPQFSHTRQSRSDKVETFTPKVSPKPTLQLKDCITQFTNDERLGADDPWYCPKCKKHQQAIKKFDIWSLPKVLIIHLKRFSFSRSWRDKIDTLVEFPVEDLDMSKYVHCPEQKNSKQLNYSLIGVANHFGGLGGGHYTAYAKNAVQNSWYSFDDALVTPTSPSNVVTRSAYVLFYQLKEDSRTE